MSSRVDKIKEKLETFAKNDLAIREAIAKRQKRLDTKYNWLRLLDLAEALNQPKSYAGKKTERTPKRTPKGLKKVEIGYDDLA